MTPRNVDTIFFDLDNTLWWFDRNSAVSLRNTFERYDLGRLVGFEEFYQVYERNNSALWELYSHGLTDKDHLILERFRRTLQMLGHKGDLIALSGEMNRFYLNDLAQQPYLIDGARELLETLYDRGYCLCILSNGFAGIQQKKLASGGIDHLITHVVLSDDCGITKPLPGIYEYAQRVTGTEPEQIVMVGDSYNTDIVGAHNAGWATIFYNPDGRTPQGVADAMVTRLSQITPMFS